MDAVRNICALVGVFWRFLGAYGSFLGGLGSCEAKDLTVEARRVLAWI